MVRSESALVGVESNPVGAESAPLRAKSATVGAESGPIGVLALQGDFREHLAVLERLGVATMTVKTASQLDEVGALVIPGGESTTISKLADIFGLTDPIRRRIAEGMPVLGTCAGLILLADEITDGIAGQHGFGGLSVEVQRNAFGNQLDSFEAEIKLPAAGTSPLKVAFIRAPVITRVLPGFEDKVAVLSTLDDVRIIAVRQGNVLGVSFHPELTGETRLHEYFLDICEKAGKAAAPA